MKLYLAFVLHSLHAILLICTFKCDIDINREKFGVPYLGDEGTFPRPGKLRFLTILVMVRNTNFSTIFNQYNFLRHYKRVLLPSIPHKPMKR